MDLYQEGDCRCPACPTPALSPALHWHPLLLIARAIPFPSQALHCALYQRFSPPLAPPWAVNIPHPAPSLS